jgi:hypothetical protein
VPYVPNELLSRLVGVRMYSVEFVLNEYIQFRFDGDCDADGPVTLNSYVWPTIEFGGRDWCETDIGYADAIRKLTPGTVQATVERTGVGLRVEFDTGAIVIHPQRDDAAVEIALIAGWVDRARMVWRPGETCFEDIDER